MDFRSFTKEKKFSFNSFYSPPPRKGKGNLKVVCPDPAALKKMMNVVSDCNGNGVAWHTQAWDWRDVRLHRLPLQLMQRDSIGLGAP